MGNFDAEVMQALAKRVVAKPPGPGIQYPITVTPRTPYMTGVAALVFVSPHTVSPADDVAEFGVQIPPPAEDPGIGWNYLPPYEGARTVVWFRPPQAGREYVLELGGDAYSLGDTTFDLDAGDGGKETVEIPLGGGPDYLRSQTVSYPISPSDRDWRWFSLSASSYWRYSSCQIVQLP